MKYEEAGWTATLGDDGSMDTLIVVTDPQGGYLLALPDGSEYEADTVPEAMDFARSEGVTRVYSAVKPDQFVQRTREDA